MNRIIILGMLVIRSMTFFAGDGKPKDLSGLFEKVDPSVVVIQTEEHATSPIDAQKVSMPSMGSGVLISEDGQVLTAAHVVDVADKINVLFTDGQKIPGSVVSVSKDADVALVKLAYPPENPVIAQLGDSDKVKPGQPVFIIGSPYGVEHTLSVGYVSGRRTETRITDDEVSVDFIQTDAAINQGNSGGPMFNMEGKVIGIVSHILSKSGGNEGLGFAASVNLAQKLLLDKPMLWGGIDTVMVLSDIAAALNIPQSAALLVQRVSEQSPARTLGLREGTLPAIILGRELMLGGDVILAVAGVSVARSNNGELIEDKLRELPVGTPIKLKILRAGALMEFSIKKQ